MLLPGSRADAYTTHDTKNPRTRPVMMSVGWCQ
jgi:hypothetical protein